MQMAVEELAWRMEKVRGAQHIRQLSRRKLRKQLRSCKLPNCRRPTFQSKKLTVEFFFLTGAK